MMNGVIEREFSLLARLHQCIIDGDLLLFRVLVCRELQEIDPECGLSITILNALSLVERGLEMEAGAEIMRAASKARERYREVVAETLAGSVLGEMKRAPGGESGAPAEASNRHDNTQMYPVVPEHARKNTPHALPGGFLLHIRDEEGACG